MMTLTETMLAPLGQTLTGLQRADDLWQRYRLGQLTPSSVVTTAPQPLGAVDWDVVISGGTLGILLGAALARRGWRVALLEKGKLQGRTQEWNISRQELQTLVELELLTSAQLQDAIATEYNPARIQFHGGDPIWVRDVLNIGVDPVTLLEQLKQTFLAAGGQLCEHTAFQGAKVHPDGVNVQAGQSFKTRLLIDAMGHFSPIVAQVRGQTKPDAVCLVVGTCAQGMLHNDSGDLIVSFTPIRQQCQYFWEAFPARDGRTTYLFTYVDAHPERPSLAALCEDYFTLLPQYQSVSLETLQLQRALFGFFPCYRHSPLSYPWDRLLPVGDSSGSQSPLSFGGFGAMIRHLPRLSHGVDDALQQDCLARADLGWLQPYQPSLSVTWLFQRAMSVPVDRPVSDPQQINRLLSTIFQDMASLGDDVLKPFLQDVVQFSPLARTLLQTSIHHPGLVLQLLPQLGLANLLDWMRHYASLGLYSGLYPLGRASQRWLEAWPQPYYPHRWLEALQYGAGRDYSSH